jgi:hypothetical protein
VFAEPDTEVDKHNLITKVSRRKNTYGAWPNYFYALGELFEAEEAKFYAIAQDDIVLCKETYRYIQNLSFPDDLGCFSLFCPKMYSGTKTWTRVGAGSQLWMAQLLIYPRHVINSIITNSSVWRFEGNAGIDNRIGAWAQENKKGVYFHSPSLVEHVGKTSTLWPKAKLEGERAAHNFVGEDFDALKLIHPLA